MRQGLQGAGMNSSAGSSSSTSAIRRIQRELKEISTSPSKQWTAAPVADDMFEWQFAVRGPPDTDFEGGVYTGRLVLPVNYPFAPPSISMLTPTGRWEVNKKICLSNTSFHPEQWQPAWGIRTMMEALRSHFPVPGDGAIGAIDWPSDIRKRLAKESLDFVSPPNACPNRDLLPHMTLEELKAEDRAESVPPELQAIPPSAETPAQDAATQGPSPDLVAAAAALPEVVPAAFPEVPAAAPPTPSYQSSAPAVDFTTSRATPVASAPAATPAAVPNEVATTSAAASSSLAAPQEEQPRRRRDGSRPQRRPQSPVIVQLLKPPRTHRGWVLLIMNVLIFLLSISFMVVVVDLVRSPPTLLDPVPDGSKESKDGQS